MGAVQVEVFNQRLMNIANYDDLAQLRNLLANLHNLEALAVTGDSVAASIAVDLKAALDNGLLTCSQRRYLVLHFLDKEPYAQLARDYHLDEATIRAHILAAVKRLQQVLNDGKLYPRRSKG